MTSERVGAAGRAHRSSVALSRYFRRLLTPPLPGDGLLLFGFLEGVLGWGLSWLFSQYPELAPVGLVESIVLTGGIIFVGVTYTAPTVRLNRVWLVLGGLNVAATASSGTADETRFISPKRRVRVRRSCNRRVPDTVAKYALCRPHCRQLSSTVWASPRAT